MKRNNLACLILNARNLIEILGLPAREDTGLYQIDMSSKNPRFIRKIWSNDQLESLNAQPLRK